MSPSPRARLPFPYRPEADAVAASLAALQGQLDWPAVIDAARSDAELKTMDPARQAMAAFARKHKQILANARWAESERKRTLPRPSPR